MNFIAKGRELQVVLGNKGEVSLAFVVVSIPLQILNEARLVH